MKSISLKSFDFLIIEKPSTFLELLSVKELRDFINSLVRENALISVIREVTIEEEFLYYRKKYSELKNGTLVIISSFFENNLVGICELSIKDRINCFISLGVKKEFRGLGVGGKLISLSIEVAKRKGLENMFLEVVEGNRAINLYKRKGFEVVGRLRNYYLGRDGKRRDLLLMQLSLI